MCSDGNTEPFHDYHIQDQWIWQYLQAGKISNQVAREQFLRACKGWDRNKEALDNLERAQTEDRIEREMRAVAVELSQQLRAFRSIPAVENWEADFTRPMPRRMVLVLEGPSQIGKTMFARSLAATPEAVFEQNVSGTVHLDLREFKWGVHTHILLDEGSPTLVLHHRKLMQGQNSWVYLGGSATGIYGYRVYVHKVRFIICCNNWSAGLNALCDADRDWLALNCVHVYETEPLWL